MCHLAVPVGPCPRVWLTAKAGRSGVCVGGASGRVVTQLGVSSLPGLSILLEGWRRGGVGVAPLREVWRRGGGVRQTDGAQPPKGALVCRGLYAAPREVPVPVTVCSLQGRAVARIKERSPRSLPPLPQGDKRCHAGFNPACKKIVPPKGRSSCKSP
ncbi:hypothetical protein AAG570_006569 [Ranatra chinensis]|uniref:Uncharacterized protein n=1 Tax=Ranatra chinensis TaxID=642074 RepID=A0ABD0Z4Z2_9HEMI